MAGVRPASHAEALALLADRAGALGVPAVDEDEERRLQGLPPFRGDDWGWAPWFIDGPSGPTYLGLRRPPVDPGAASGPAAGPIPVAELAPAGRGGAGPAALVDGLTVAATLAEGPVDVWVRAIAPAALAAATAGGATVVRTIRVLARPLARPLDDLPPPATVPADVVIRPWRPGDDAGVVGVLAAAHPARLRPWSAAELDRRRSAAWFRAEDLLVAAAGDRLLGVHWLKRRDGRTGEVHNLALHPDGQGRGLGGALLDAGLVHLARLGLADVLLWMDDANAPAAALYASRGFTERCRDVLLRVPADQAAPRGPRSPGGTSL